LRTVLKSIVVNHRAGIVLKFFLIAFNYLKNDEFDGAAFYLVGLH
jgi:hypothetical protein